MRTAPGKDAPRIAVLGGTGWVGRHVCELARRQGHDVVVVARRPAPHVAGHRFVALDLAAAGAGEIGGVLREHRAGVLVNATDAANATDGWARSEEEMAGMNVGLVRRLLQAAGALPWRTRLVHIGTVHEYGEVPVGTAMDETLRPDPRTAYTRTKLAGSEAVLAAVRAGEVDGLVLRAANVSGPHPSPASFPGKLVRMLREAAAEGRPMTVALTDARRDFVDVRDVADAVMRAATATASGRALNIGSGTAVDMRTLVRLFVAGAGFPPETVHEEHRDVRSLGGGWTCTDIRLAGELLGWRPRITLADSLRDMWRAASED